MVKPFYALPLVGLMVKHWHECEPAERFAVGRFAALVRTEKAVLNCVPGIHARGIHFGIHQKGTIESGYRKKIPVVPCEAIEPQRQPLHDAG